MTEKEIELLGFEKIVIEDEETFHYYAFDITNGLSFITPANTDIEDDKWYVEVFNTQDPIRFYKFEEVQKLLNTLERAKVKN